MFIYILKVLFVVFAILSLFIFVDINYTKSVYDIAPRKNITNLIMGDSHTQTAINDTLINSCFNSSWSSENYFYTFYKLLYYNKKFKVRNVIIGFSNHNISSLYNNFNDNLNNKSGLIHKYMPIIDIKGKWILFKSSPVIFLSAIQEVFKYEINYLLKKNDQDKLPWEGRYYDSKYSNLDDSIISKSSKRHYYDEKGQVRELSNIQIEYLNKIMEFCNDNNINVILIKTPLNEKYNKMIPVEFKGYFDNLCKNLNGNCFFDFSNIYFENNLFGDGDHLNYFGALKFSKIISDTLKNCGGGL